MRVRTDADHYALPGQSNLRFDPAKNWAAKYLQCTWNLRRLRTLYLDHRTVEDDIRNAITLTLGSCSELADWLVAGSEPRQITQGMIDRFTAVDPLRSCRALAGRSTATAVVVPTRIRGSVRAWVEYREPAKAPLRFDALDLADRSVAAWNDFLIGHGVRLPTWA